MAVPPVPEIPLPKEGAALALSGGGFRAALFHLGGLWRLNELGWLRRLSCLAGASAGAIVAAWLGLRWGELRWDGEDRAVNFTRLLVDPLRELCAKDIDVPVTLAALLRRLIKPPLELSQFYERHLFGDATLEQLPAEGAGPCVMLLATNLLSGGLVQFGRDALRDARLGELALSDMPLATAVAASCSLPPFFPPVELNVDPGAWENPPPEPPPDGDNLRRGLSLVDGGFSDNLALEAVWDEYPLLLVSDASSPLTAWPWVFRSRRVQILRTNRVLIDRLRALRKRVLLVHKYADPACPQGGAYWGITTEIDSYRQADALTQDSEQTRKLGYLRTRLNRFRPAEQGRLINWGYALADAALRRWVIADAEPPAGWPVPEHPL